jgi:hypothetical protein
MSGSVISAIPIPQMYQGLDMRYRSQWLYRAAHVCYVKTMQQHLCHTIIAALFAYSKNILQKDAANRYG